MLRCFVSSVPQGAVRLYPMIHPWWRGPWGISMGFLWGFYRIPVGFPRYFHDVSMIFLWDYYGNSYGVSLWLLCYFFYFYLWSFYGISMIFLWDFFGISMIFLLDRTMIFLWDFHWIPSKLKVLSHWKPTNTKMTLASWPLLDLRETNFYYPPAI